MSLRPRSKAAPLLGAGLLLLFTPVGAMLRHVPLTRLSGETLHVEVRSPDSTAPIHLALRLARFGRAGELAPVPAAVRRSGDGRVELDRGRLIEWFVRLPGGVEHGFDLDRPPDGERNRPLVFEIEVAGDGILGLEGSDLVVRSAEGVPALRYGALSAFDAVERPLDARMELEGSVLRILVDDRDAVYPVRVDPMAAVADRILEINELGAGLGAAVAAAGDVNGDGFPDLLAGAPGCDHGQSNEGCAYLYLGGVGGAALTPAWTTEGNQAEAEYGKSLAGVGDVNGDGFDDVVVGAREAGNGQAGEGLVYLYLGSASGLSTTPARVLEGNQAGAAFGWSVAGAGDVNNDGFDDVIVGAPYHSTGLEIEDGRAAVFLGSATGLPATPAWSIEGVGDEARAGFVVAGLGDTNGDTYDDVLVVSPGYTDETVFRSAAFMYTGSASGPSATPFWRGYNSDPFYLTSFGDAAAGIGDINNDGLDDFAITDYTYTDEGAFHRGRVMLFLGSTPGPPGLEPIWDILGTGDLDHLGIAVTATGDVNGDGEIDLLHGSQAGDGLEGGAFLHLGTGGSLQPGWLWSGNVAQSFTGFGDAVAGPGDMNGDGFADWAIGAPSFDNGQINEGQVHIFYGCAEADGDAVCTVSDNCPLVANATQADQDLDGHGNACDCQPQAGDVWSPPGPASGLTMSHDGATGETLLSWSAPALPGGGISPAYDVLRSGSGSDFLNGTDCLESADSSDREALDPSTPPAGTMRFFLVRPLNLCGASGDGLGAGSDGTPRQGRTCP